MDELTQRIIQLTPEKKALLALRLREQQPPPPKGIFYNEPIAVTGLSCRFPGEVTDAFSYWQMLALRTDAITDIPPERWDISAYYDPRPAMSGKMNTRWGGFLKDIDMFDPKFFHISPREAVSLDPQQRLLLELCWEALRDADLSPDQLDGSLTGIFVGINGHDYANLQLADLRPESADAYYGTGSSNSFAAGRISYWLGAQGPSMAVDTACSSSLVAVHLACQSLRAGESHLALAGGVNLILSPIGSVYLSQVRALSPNGRCRAFSEEADGVVRGEGCAVVVLKRLSDALAAGDAIWAVIRGTAVNQDGRSNGLTAPNGLAQEAVIRQALDNARVRPEQIGYVEAHGTGTPLGDPLEVGALEAVLRGKNAAQPLMIGSVKTNLGHLEAAAGIAGLIKTILVLNQQAIPANLHFQQPSSYIPWDRMKINVPTALTPWFPPDQQNRLAGVSSFGFSGTNAHLILEETTGLAASGRSRKLVPSPPSPWQKERFWINIPTASEKSPANTCRADLVSEADSGVLIVESDLNKAPCLEKCLRRLEESWGTDGSFAVNRFQLAPLVFFTADRESFFYVNQIENSLIALIYVGSPADLPKTIGEFVRFAERHHRQPSIFLLEDDIAAARQCGLSATPCGVWQGITDLAAFTLSGNRMRRLRYALAHYQKHGQCRTVEYFPGQDNQTEMEIEQVIDEWMALKGKSDIFVEPLKRQLQNPGQAEFRYRFFLTRRDGKLESVVVLSPYGQGTGYLMDLEFYRQDIPLGGVETGIVQIIETLNREGCRILSLGGTFGVKLDDHPLADAATADFFRTLQKENILNGDSNYQFKSKFRPEEKRIFVCRPLVADGSDLQNLILMLGDPAGTRSTVRKNGNPQQVGFEKSNRPLPARHNPLLGRQILLAAINDKVFETRLNCARLPYLDDHRIRSQTILPGTAFLEMLLALAGNHFRDSLPVIKNVRLHTPLFLSQSADVTVQLKITSPTETAEPVAEIFSLIDNSDPAENGWQLHVTAQLAAVSPAPAGSERFDSIEDIRQRCPNKCAGTYFYQTLRRAGFDYGPLFQGIREIQFNEREVIGLIEWPAGLGEQFTEYHIHPAVLDACLQTLAALAPDFASQKPADLFLLAGLKRLSLYRPPGDRIWCHAVLTSNGKSQAEDTITADLVLLDDSANPIAGIEGLQARRVSSNFLRNEPFVPEHDWFYEINWQLSPLPQPAFSALNRRQVRSSKELSIGHDTDWLVFGREGCALTGRLLEQLSAAGVQYRLVVPAETLPLSANSRNGSGFSVAPEPDRLNPADPVAYRHLLKSWFESLEPSTGASSNPAAGVIWLWSATVPEPVDEPSESAARAQWNESAGQCRQLLWLIQALLTGQPETARRTARLWVVTAEAQPAADLVSRMRGAAAAGLWGLGAVLSREHPEVWGGLIDVERETVPEAAIQITQEIFKVPDESIREEQVGYRNGLRYVARLGRARLKQGTLKQVSVRSDGWYLVSGGLGGLGLAVGEWLLGRGAGRVVLASRGSGSDWPERVRRMQENFGGERVEAVPTDIGRWSEVSGLVSRENERSGQLKLRGVIHSAGEVADGVLVRQDWERFERVLRAKVAGGWNLHYATLEEEPDFFILFSSAAVVFGNPGQGNHAAANSCLDALAHYRHSRGLPALSINWSGWDEIGAALKFNVGQRSAEQGILLIKPVEGLKALSRLMQTDNTQTVVLPVDWRRWQKAQNRAGITALFKSLITDLSGETGNHRAIQENSQTESMAEEQAGDRSEKNSLKIYLRQLVAGLLGISGTRIDDQTPLSDYGFDSLMTVDLRGRLIRDLEVKIAVNDLFRNLTLEKLQHQIQSQLAGRKAVVSDSKPLPDLTKNIEELSEEDINDLLNQRLAGRKTLS